jgi:3',5'-cyclic AMP phosphodiesterase CpdA
VRLAHCSDLHLLSHDGAAWWKLVNKRWIGAANLLTNRSRHYHVAAFEQMVDDLNALGVEHVLCTGDVTNLALEQEFEFARGKFDKLAGGPEHVTVIPGNHDAYVAEGIGLFARIFDAYHTPDPGWVSPPSARPEAERENDTTYDARWPIVRVRGELALVGVTTSRATAWFTAYGKVGEPQLDKLRRVLADPRLAGKARVVAIHHPPAGKWAANRIRGLHDHEAFADVLREVGADLVVHGHEHRNIRETLPGPNGTTIPVLGVWSGTYNGDKPGRLGRYRIFDIEGGKIVGEHVRVWRPDDGGFVAEAVPLQQSNP